MNKEYQLVKIFHEEADFPTAKRPAALSEKRLLLRYKLLKDELEELPASKDDVVAQADSFIDLIYYALGGLVEMGVEPDVLFEIVHEANLKKVDSGKPSYENGKLQKPEDWQHPDEDLRKEILRQIEEATTKKERV